MAVEGGSRSATTTMFSKPSAFRRASVPTSSTPTRSVSPVVRIFAFTSSMMPRMTFSNTVWGREAWTSKSQK